MRSTKGLPLPALIVTAACAVGIGVQEGYGPVPRARSTYEKVLLSAEEGDAAAQNQLGFMLFFGESAPRDVNEASTWFRSAAAQGSAVAQLNLAVMHYLGVGAPRDAIEAQRYFDLAIRNRTIPPLLDVSSLPALVEESCQDPQPPQEAADSTFLVYCAGCHGWNGIAEYGGSPSFALGERMEKTDGELLRSIFGGHGEMPEWSDKLPEPWLRAALRFARSLQWEHNYGVLHRLRTPPEFYFRFGPMSSDFGSYPRDPSVFYGNTRETLKAACALRG